MKKKLQFNVNAYAARLIGRENISNLEGAIVELVKNTYDADAHDCILYFENSSDILYIMDNGIGMTEDIIKKHWMTIGNSSKDVKYLSKSGRIQTGAKGIGRFALDRISDKCEMITINTDNKIIWNVDWNNFKRDENITDIYAEIEETNLNIPQFCKNIKNKNLKNKLLKSFKNNGTVFKLTALRNGEWNNEKVLDIRQTLSSLIPPNIKNEFSIYFYEESTSTEDALIVAQNIDTFDYQTDFIVSEEGNVHVEIIRNEFDFKNEFDEVMDKAKFTKEDREYFKGKKIIKDFKLKELISLTKEDSDNPIGKFYGTIYFYKLMSTTKDKEKYYYKDSIGRKNMIKNFGGVKLYRDGFRVKPYGEYGTSDYDWLLLANRNRKSPAALSHKTGRWTASSDQILGTIYISRLNEKLKDQSNREGIIDTREFELFKQTILEIISEFENDRQYVGRKLSDYYDEKTEVERLKKQFLEQAEKKRKQQDNKEKENSKSKKSEQNKNTTLSIDDASKVIEKQDETIEDLNQENITLMPLATIGISTNTYIHEIEESHHILERKIALIKKEIVKNTEKEKIMANIEQVQNTIERMNSWFSVTLHSIRKKKRELVENNINKIIEEQINLWNNINNGRNIIINFENTEIVMFECIECEIISIISNLVSNSIASFENGNNNEKNIINIKLIKKDNGFKIEYNDNGYGLAPIYKNNPYKILEANETSKINKKGQKEGTGMGMWIINNIVTKYKGTIELSKNTNEEEGFYIDINIY